MQGSGGVYLYHLSPSEPDNVLQISFPSVTPMASVEIASVQELSIAVDMCYLGARCCMGAHWEGRKKKALPFNEVAVKLEELLIFFTLLSDLKGFLYLRMI